MVPLIWFERIVPRVEIVLVVAVLPRVNIGRTDVVLPKRDSRKVVVVPCRTILNEIGKLVCLGKREGYDMGGRKERESLPTLFLSSRKHTQKDFEETIPRTTRQYVTSQYHHGRGGLFVYCPRTFTQQEIWQQSFKADHDLRYLPSTAAKCVRRKATDILRPTRRAISSWQPLEFILQNTKDCLGLYNMHHFIPSIYVLEPVKCWLPLSIALAIGRHPRDNQNNKWN